MPRLVVSLRQDEPLFIGDEIVVVLRHTNPGRRLGQVRVSINAPAHLKILRSGLVDPTRLEEFRRTR